MSEEEIQNEVVSVKDDMKKVLVNRKDDYDYARELLYASAERLQDVLDSAIAEYRKLQKPIHRDLFRQNAVQGGVR